MPVPISSGYSSSMGMPSALSASPYSSMHNKHPAMSTGYYPSPNTMLRPGQSHSQTYISSPSALQQPNFTWSTGHMKPSVIVSKSSTPTSIVPPAGSISNGTPIRPPSRDQPAAPPATSSSSAAPPSSQAQCYAGVMNMKSGTLCGTLTPVTLGDLSRPSRVKATTANIPTACDVEYTVASPNPSIIPSSHSARTPSQASAPSTPNTPGVGPNSDPPGLMPPPELPKFVLAPTPAQLGRAPFQRRQSSSTVRSLSPNSSHSEEEPSPSPGSSSATHSFSLSAISSSPSTSTSNSVCVSSALGPAPLCSPTAATAAVSGGFTVPAGPSTPNVPPSPGQNNSGAQTASAAKKSVFKRNKDGGVDKYAVDFLVCRPFKTEGANLP